MDNDPRLLRERGGEGRANSRTRGAYINYYNDQGFSSTEEFNKNWKQNEQEYQDVHKDNIQLLNKAKDEYKTNIKSVKKADRQLKGFLDTLPSEEEVIQKAYKNWSLSGIDFSKAPEGWKPNSNSAGVGGGGGGVLASIEPKENTNDYLSGTNNYFELPEEVSWDGGANDPRNRLFNNTYDPKLTKEQNEDKFINSLKTNSKYDAAVYAKFMESAYEEVKEKYAPIYADVEERRGEIQTAYQNLANQKGEIRTSRQGVFKEQEERMQQEEDLILDYKSKLENIRNIFGGLSIERG